MWDLWLTEWHWDRFFPEYFGFPLSVSFHLCSITWKKGKKRIIFITGLHHKPEGCSASIASAAGPFTTKKKQLTQLDSQVSCVALLQLGRVMYFESVAIHTVNHSTTTLHAAFEPLKRHKSQQSHDQAKQGGVCRVSLLVTR